MAIDITPSKRRKPLNINFGDRRVVLPGIIPMEMIVARDSIPRPKVMAGSQKASYESEIGIAVIAAFATYVIPDDARDVVGVDDIPAFFDAWSEHVGWGKAPSSSNSSKNSKSHSSSNSDEDDSE